MVIFGASGDLTRRKLIPALFHLEENQMLPAQMQIIGVARTDYTGEQFRESLRQSLAKDGKLKPAHWQSFSQRLSYLSGDYDDADTYRRIAAELEHIRPGGTPQDHMFYLAIPPEVYETVICRLGEAGLNHNSGRTCIIIEKPFGHSLDSARELDEIVHRFFDESQVYRIDHYLGKETVQNILAFRFANYVFQEVWERKYIDHVQITAAESQGVVHRSGYYDAAGVVRDMLQNHMLQLVTLVAMEPPVAMNADELRNEKVKVLKAMGPLQMSDAVWGQYQGYRNEPGIPPNSTTPTFIALKLFIHNWRWQGVPFYLRTGKALAEKSTEITIQFKYVPSPLLPGRGAGQSNCLTFCIQPNESIHLCFNLKTPGMDMTVQPVTMNFSYKALTNGRRLADAYERLLLDAMQGDPSLFARSDEIDCAWELVSGLLNSWEATPTPPLLPYTPGSWGPQAAQELLHQAGRAWMHCSDSGEGTQG